MTTKTALITGASSGIGAVYADRLARQGYDLILVARNWKRLEAVAQRINTATGRKIKLVKADLSQPQESAKVEALLAAGGIDVLVNNAGFGAVAPLVNSDIATMVEMIDINVTALTRLTYAAVPAFIKQGSGTLINIASIVAVGPEILNGVYGGTKAYVLALTQSLQHELSDKGIRVQAVLPGATATDFWDTAGLSHDNLPNEIVMRTEDMVDAALAGLAAGEVVTIPPLQDGSAWDAYEAMRKQLSQQFGHHVPGPRYLPRPAA
ncbi:MAG: SDR family oxidoreductase [Oxalicibacterium faecigallinarum]|uniref:Oxidoreductase n=1 Tax=Oxalicibacterium faecigallinarum TaxID=573741 RepID=A0A8J3F317_9BURK|nr:SDR family oxidoreductase [Oxalicibacterium faecigallinarum]MDQ7970418.1 SDR family oxidoreductase [Oxalicibacterium faecigallinarum]GGI18331.1 oxidoreductase [Oxalicibacterium faecigallinarum]